MRVLTLVLLLAAAVSGCASPRTTFVLLPDPDGEVGAITIDSKDGPKTLDRDRDSIVLGGSESSGLVTTITNEDIDAFFGPALAVQPRTPSRFQLYFLFDTAILDDESQQRLFRVVRTIKERNSDDIRVNGHTDRTGRDRYNINLSRARAEKVKRELVSLGVEQTSISVYNHGEGNPLIPTGDGVPEPLNRRVEVVVR